MTSVAELKKEMHDVCRAALEQLKTAKGTLTGDDLVWARQRFVWWADLEARVRNRVEHPQRLNLPRGDSGIPSISPDLDEFEAQMGIGNYGLKTAVIEGMREEESRAIEDLEYLRAEFAKDSAYLNWSNASTIHPQARKQDPLEAEYEEAMQNEVAHPVISYAAVAKALKKKERQLRKLVSDAKLISVGRMITTASVKAYLRGNMKP